MYETLIETWCFRLKWGVNQVHTTTGSWDIEIWEFSPFDPFWAILGPNGHIWPKFSKICNQHEIWIPTVYDTTIFGRIQNFGHFTHFGHFLAMFGPKRAPKGYILPNLQSAWNLDSNGIWHDSKFQPFYPFWPFLAIFWGPKRAPKGYILMG